MIDAFVEAVSQQHQPEISGESALHSMEVIFANQRSSVSGKLETVEE